MSCNVDINVFNNIIAAVTTYTFYNLIDNIQVDNFYSFRK